MVAGAESNGLFMVMSHAGAPAPYPQVAASGIEPAKIPYESIPRHHPCCSVSRGTGIRTLIEKLKVS